MRNAFAVTVFVLGALSASAAPLMPGEILVTDGQTGMPAISQIDPTTGEESTFSQSGPDEGVVVRSDGRVFAIGFGGLFEIDRDTGGSTLLASIEQPGLITTDQAGNLLVKAVVRVPTFQSAILRVNPNTLTTEVVGQGGFVTGDIRAMTVLQDGRVLFTNSYGAITLDPDSGAQSFLTTDPQTSGWVAEGAAQLANGDILIGANRTSLGFAGLLSISVLSGEVTELLELPDLVSQRDLQLTNAGDILLLDRIGGVVRFDGETLARHDLISGSAFGFPTSISSVPTIIPEPSTFVLVSSGLLILGAKRGLVCAGGMQARSSRVQAGALS